MSFTLRLFGFAFKNHYKSQIFNVALKRSKRFKYKTNFEKALECYSELYEKSIWLLHVSYVQCTFDSQTFVHSYVRTFVRKNLRT